MIATALSFVFLLGAVGLSIDIGRMYITHNEVQAFADSASLAAALQLDETPAGITRATNARGGNADKWRFDTTPITNVTTTFGTSANGPFTSTPPNPPRGYTFAKVVAVVNLPMSLLAPIVGRNAQISASAVAGGTPLSTLTNGFPFSPYTRIASPDLDPDHPGDPFGYKVGNQYTLRWGAPGDRTTCGTDATRPNLAQNGKIRGYCCAGSAASIRAAIISLNTDPVTIGDPVPMDNGAKNTEMTTIADRVDLDPDKTSSTYAAYRSAQKGNGTRVVVVAVNAGPPNYTAVGFAAFFLLPDTAYDKLNGNESACAEYIGPVSGSSNPSGGSAVHIRLVQ